MATWKRLVLVSVAGGAGFALMLAVIVGIGFWYSSRPPKPWDTRAIKATFDYIDAEGDHNNLVFYYTLENTTDTDYQLGQDTNVELMGKLTQGSLVLGRGHLRLELPVFIPAKQRARTSVHLEAPYAYYGEKLKDGATPDARKKYRERLTAFVQTELVNLGGFTLFDHTRRYQIDFPDGWRKK